jgi:predicted transcriptional regulator
MEVVMASWKKSKAQDIMSAPVKSLHASASLNEAVQFLSDWKISGAPCIDGSGECVGVVSLYDIVAFLAASEGNLGQRGPNYESRDSDALEENRVSDVMTGEMISVNPETPLPEVVALMNDRRIHRVLVQEDGKPVGVVSTLDVLGVVTQA